jgi:transcriptional regulator with XRE-family HTH domain
MPGGDPIDETRPAGYSPTIRKRTLSRRLVELRKACGLTTTDVQRQLGWSASKLNYIEKAKWIKPDSDDVTDLCELYGAEGAQRDALIQLAREGRQRGWWRKYDDVFPDEYPGFEAGAAQIYAFEPVFIPGLLQVPGYIELVTRASGIDDPAEVQRCVDARVERQKILARDTDPCRLHAVIDENAILRITVPAIRRAQLAHLVEITGRPHVDVQVLPIAAGVYPVPGEAFTCLSFPDPSERALVYLETAVDDRMLEETDEVDRYMLKFQQLAAAALSPEDTRTTLKRQME